MPVYHIENSILGSFHQGSSQFGDTAGRQCACNSLFSILWSKVRNINLWTQHDLDEILIEGDKLYKSLNTQSYLSVDDLPSFIPINGSMANVHLLNLHTCEASLVTGSPFLRTPLQNCSNKQMLLFINGFTLAIFQSEYGDTCHLFDSHSKDEQGLSVSNGKSVLLTFANLIELEAYIQVLYLEYQSRETIYFQIQYVDFSIDDDTIQDLRATFRNTLRCKSRKVTRQEYYNKMRSDPNFKEKRKNIYEKDKEKRKQKYQNEKERRKQKYQNEKERRSQKYQEKKEKKKQNYQEEKEKLKQPRFSDNIYLNKEKLFKKQILSGPFYTCVCCHRCLYEHSVRKYCPKNYKFSVELYCKLVSSFDGFYYICRTCNDKFKKKKIPCQSVSNKLEIFELPHDLKHIRRLERVLIAKRIIFKKVTIMQKGQSPKVKGALCNVPVDYIDTTNILPRQADSNGIILVKLKRKLDYRGHVYFEGVRPNFIMRMLCHLRAWNHLYKDIEINIGNIPSDLVNLSENGSNNDPVAILQYLTRDISEPIDLLLESSAVTQPSTNNDIHEDSNLEFTEDPLNEYCTPADETVMMSNISKANDIDNEILNLAPGEGANPINILSDEYCEELAHPHLFPTGKFGYRVERKIPLTATKYFNQRLLNYTQRFASDSDYIFFANSVVQQLNLSNQMNIAMKKVSSTNLTAGMFSNNFKETVRQFVSNDKAFGFMSTIKGTPAYWKKFLQEVLAMVKQLGPPTFFLTLSCADLRWNDLVSIISKLKGSEMSDEKLNLLSYEERCRLLNSNPVLVARHFQYRVESFFKHILIDGPLGKTQYYATRVEFQVRGSPHIHCFLWTKDVPLMNGDKEAYIQHIDSKISAVLPSESENKKMFDLVRVFQLHRHSKTCKKYRNKNCRFNFGKYFTENTIISEPLPKEMDYLEKKKIIQWCQEILEPVKKYINNELNPKNTNFF